MSRERDKGLAAEREVVQVAREHGFHEARRSGDAGQWDKHEDDVLHVSNLRMSVKRHERLRLDEWSAEVEANVQGDELPVVVYRRSRQPWRVSIRLDDFLDLLERADGQP